MSEPNEKIEGIPGKTGRLYTQSEVKTRKTLSGIGGILFGAISTLITGVILNKVAKTNITDKATEIADAGIAKLKAIPSKFKKEAEEVKEN